MRHLWIVRLGNEYIMLLDGWETCSIGVRKVLRLPNDDRLKRSTCSGQVCAFYHPALVSAIYVVLQDRDAYPSGTSGQVNHIFLGLDTRRRGIGLADAMLGDLRKAVPVNPS
jgi:hypothetical protein